MFRILLCFPIALTSKFFQLSDTLTLFWALVHIDDEGPPFGLSFLAVGCGDFGDGVLSAVGKFREGHFPIFIFEEADAIGEGSELWILVDLV